MTGVAVVGVGLTRFGTAVGRTADDLALEAAVAALADAGVAPGRVDGLVAQRVRSYEALAVQLGVEPRYTLQVPAEGRMTGPAIMTACLAIEAGLCDVAVLAYGNDGRSRGHRYGARVNASSEASEGYGTTDELLLPVGMTSPGAFYAMLLRRYAEEYGDPVDALAELAIGFRAHAVGNPGAVARTPLTREEYDAARWVVRPMRLLDYCRVDDGGVALVLARGDLARDLVESPVPVLGFGQQGRLTRSSEPPSDYWRASTAAASAAAHARAGTGPGDLGALMVYDNFSPNVLFSLEGLGLCGPGEAADWVLERGVGPGVDLPLNTSGGHLSEGYMQGWALNAEAVRRARSGTSLVQYVATAPICSSILYGGAA